MFPSIYSIFRANSSIRGNSLLILAGYFMGIIVYSKSLTSAYPGIKNAWSICLQAFFYSDFLAKLPLDFGANYYTKSNVHSYFVLQNRTPYSHKPSPCYDSLCPALLDFHLPNLSGPYCVYSLPAGSSTVNGSKSSEETNDENSNWRTVSSRLKSCIFSSPFKSNVDR
jgi:hypothetical protein